VLRRHQARAVPRVVRRRHWTKDRADHSEPQRIAQTRAARAKE
jgi:hypothetical protein